MQEVKPGGVTKAERCAMEGHSMRASKHLFKDFGIPFTIKFHWCNVCNDVVKIEKVVIRNHESLMKVKDVPGLVQFLTARKSGLTTLKVQ